VCVCVREREREREYVCVCVCVCVCDRPAVALAIAMTMSYICGHVFFARSNCVMFYFPKVLLVCSCACSFLSNIVCTYCINYVVFKCFSCCAVFALLTSLVLLDFPILKTKKELQVLES
jgi:hypothetical protein